MCVLSSVIATMHVIFARMHVEMGLLGHYFTLLQETNVRQSRSGRDQVKSDAKSTGI